MKANDGKVVPFVSLDDLKAKEKRRELDRIAALEEKRKAEEQAALDEAEAPEAAEGEEEAKEKGQENLAKAEKLN